MDPQDREQRIRDRAYAIWVEEGRPDGRDQQHWHDAESAIDEEDGAVTPLHDIGADPAPIMPPNR